MLTRKLVIFFENLRLIFFFFKKIKKSTVDDPSIENLEISPNPKKNRGILLEIFISIYICINVLKYIIL
jgi:hypothetical protein